MNRRGWISSVLLVITVTADAVGLGAWKYESIQASVEASIHQPESMESVTVALTREVEQEGLLTAGATG